MTQQIRQVTPSSEQELAIEMCNDTRQRIVSVTGGAGTGKTYVLGEAYRAMMQAGHSTALCAPTGRAARRIYELTGIKAKTIHKLLEFPQPDDDPILDNDNIDDDVELRSANEPKRNQYFPFDQRMIFVDEASMVGPTLYRQLLNALQKRGCIRFFGDNQQLLPVEEGDPPFRTLLTTKPAVTLNYNFRSDDAVVSNAMRILGGRIPIRNDRFELIYTESPIHELINFVKTHHEFATLENQIIMPTRKGKVGTMYANPLIQVKLNKSGPLLRLPRFEEHEKELPVRANDKFLWVKNDYALNLFNGEIGTITAIDEEDGSLRILTSDDRHVEIPARLKTFNSFLRTVINYDPRKEMELGYAVTTHKSQGSEFDTVVYCISSSSAYLLNRNNFYTAVTRARNRVVVIADRRAMSLALRRETNR